MYANKDILVTGGCGSIGSEIVRQLLKYNPSRIRVYDNHEHGHFLLKNELKDARVKHLLGDIRDRERLQRACEGVDFLYHAAAYKHIDFCQYDPFDAVSTNVFGTQNVISAAIATKVKKVIGISTDKAVSPSNTMGATKLLAEQLFMNAPFGFTQIAFTSVRFGNVLNSSGSVIPLFKSQAMAGTNITVTDKRMTRFCMTISEAAKLVLNIGVFTEGNEIYILNNMRSIRIYDLAETIKEHYKSSSQIIFTGIRDGEKLFEELYSLEELPHIEVLKDMYRVTKKIHKHSGIPPRTSNEVKILSKNEIKDLLFAEGILCQN